MSRAFDPRFKKDRTAGAPPEGRPLWFRAIRGMTGGRSGDRGVSDDLRSEWRQAFISPDRGSSRHGLLRQTLFREPATGVDQERYNRRECISPIAFWTARLSADLIAGGRRGLCFCWPT